MTKAVTGGWKVAEDKLGNCVGDGRRPLGQILSQVSTSRREARWALLTDHLIAYEEQAAVLTPTMSCQQAANRF